MRKHSVRKWLHAILDLLPVIILPIFAIYSHRHTIDSYEVTVPQNEVVNFNQLIEVPIGATGVFATVDVTNNLNGSITINGTATSNNSGFLIGSFTFDSGDILLVKTYDNIIVTNNIDWRHTYGSYRITTTSNVLELSLWLEQNVTYNSVVFYPQLVNLTEMFGSGNEPTAEQFNTWYPNDYYEYNTGTKQLLKGVNTVTYDNDDIGSQMIYSLYKPINDYFNLNNVFNFGAIYDWFELNMFNGNAPLSIFIVWNIIVYEFIMDIIFLIYSVFMFVIDFATNTLDRFTGWAKRGD